MAATTGTTLNSLGSSTNSKLTSSWSRLLTACASLGRRSLSWPQPGQVFARVSAWSYLQWCAQCHTIQSRSLACTCRVTAPRTSIETVGRSRSLGRVFGVGRGWSGAGWIRSASSERSNWIVRESASCPQTRSALHPLIAQKSTLVLCAVASTNVSAA